MNLQVERERRLTLKFLLIAGGRSIGGQFKITLPLQIVNHQRFRRFIRCLVGLTRNTDSLTASCIVWLVDPVQLSMLRGVDRIPRQVVQLSLIHI